MVTEVFTLIPIDMLRTYSKPSSPLVAGLLILLIVVTFHHTYLGLQVVIEDYVHHEGTKLALLLLVQAACILLGLVGLLSVLMLLFGK